MDFQNVAKNKYLLREIIGWQTSDHFQEDFKAYYLRTYVMLRANYGIWYANLINALKLQITLLV